MQNDQPKHPFQVGARVAVSFRSHFREDFVVKLYKSGRFVLRNNPDAQWRPMSGTDSSGIWKAHGAGQNYGTLYLHDALADPFIAERNAEDRRRTKRVELRVRLDRMPEEKVTDEMLSKIEEALNAA